MLLSARGHEIIAARRPIPWDTAISANPPIIAAHHAATGMAYHAPNLGGEMEIRSGLVLALLASATPLHAQQIRSASGPQPVPRYTLASPKASNLGAEPLKCEQHVDPRIRLYCADIERSLIQGEARRQGMPTPSSEIVRMPAYGGAEAKQLGAACMGGTAMRRLSNGWEQLRNAKGEWLRCREQ